MWLTMGVKTSIPWPKELKTTKYENNDIELIPETKDTPPSVRIQLNENLPTLDAGREFLNRFFSSLCWAEDGYIYEILSVGSGNKGVTVGKSPNISITAYKFYDDYIPSGLDNKQKLALALYREAQSANSVSYKFLSYFKILNINLNNTSKHTSWINDNITFVNNKAAIKKLNEIGKINIGKYMYSSGRCAVAHAYDPNDLINPDSDKDIKRLHSELPIIKNLSEIFIEKELGIKSMETVINEHLYELSGIKRIFSKTILDLIATKKPVDLSKMKFPLLTIGEQFDEKFETFKLMKCKDIQANKGKVITTLVDQKDTIEIRVGFDFNAERLEWDIFNVATNADKENTTEMYRTLIDWKKFQKQMLLNGRFSIYDGLTGFLLGRTSDYVPTNIDLVTSCQNIDKEISQYEALISS